MDSNFNSGITSYDLNPDSYSDKQIYELLNIDVNDKESLSVDNIRKTTDNIIKTLKEEKDFKLISFVNQLKNKILTDNKLSTFNKHQYNKDKIKQSTKVNTCHKNNNLDYDVSNDSEEENMESFENNDLSNDYMLLPKEFLKETIKPSDNIYQKDNPNFNINKNYSVPGLGSTRQNIKNISTRTQVININSKYRKNNFLSKIIGYNFNIDDDSQKFIKNTPKIFETTDYDVTLSETLTNVVSIKLYSIAIPYTFYNISTAYGNNTLFFKVLEKIRDPEFNDQLVETYNEEDPSTYNIVILQDGQYYPNSDDESNIYRVINNHPSFSKYFNMRYDKITGKTNLIVLPNVEKFKLVFYDKKFDRELTFRENTTEPGYINYLNKIKSIKCNNNAKSNVPKIDSCLGYLLGFRNLAYTETDLEFEESRESVLINARAFYAGTNLRNVTDNTDNTNTDNTNTDVPKTLTDVIKNGIINQISDPINDAKEQYLGPLRFKFSESLVDLFGTKYFVIAIDDFQKNNFNSSILSLESSLPITNARDFRNNLKVSYESSTKTTSTETNKNCSDFVYTNKILPNTISSGNKSSNTVPSLSIPKKLTYSLNAVKQTSEQIKNSPDLSDQVSRKNILGFIPIKKPLTNNLGEYYIEFGGTLQNNERLYTGPVDIHKFKIQLFNDNGQLIDLNNHDWSFSLIVEHQYQY